jgi:hypothetical protein
MLDWNELDRPTLLDRLIDKLNRAFRTVPDIDVIKDRTVTGGVVGTPIAHGRPGRVPLDAFARWAPGLGGSPIPYVTEVTSSYVRVVANANCKVNVLVIW